MDITLRQKEYLKLIVDNYIQYGEPVSSQNLIRTNNLKVSSATIRNEMVILEKLGFIEKAHDTSGRVPSQKGYQFYAKNLAESESEVLSKKIKNIFKSRELSIDKTLDNAAQAISEIVGLTLVTSVVNDDSEKLKSINLTPLNEKQATIVLVTSSGRVESKFINFTNDVNLDDIKVATRIFKERLLDQKISTLFESIQSLQPILKKFILNYEAVIKAFVNQVFDFETEIKNNVYGNTNLIQLNDISRQNIAKIIYMIEHNSVWSVLESGTEDDDENLKIDIRSDHTSIISKRIQTENNLREISLIGSNRMNYGQAKQALQLLENFLNKEDKAK